jgi:hypothetical protein
LAAPLAVVQNHNHDQEHRVLRAPTAGPTDGDEEGQLPETVLVLRQSPVFGIAAFDGGAKRNEKISSTKSEIHQCSDRPQLFLIQARESQQFLLLIWPLLTPWRRFEEGRPSEAQRYKQS